MADVRDKLADETRCACGHTEREHYDGVCCQGAPQKWCDCTGFVADVAESGEVYLGARRQPQQPREHAAANTIMRSPYESKSTQDESGDDARSDARPLLSAGDVATKLLNVSGHHRYELILAEWLDSFTARWKAEEEIWRSQAATEQRGRVEAERGFQVLVDALTAKNEAALGALRDVLANQSCSCGGWTCPRCELAVSEAEKELQP